MTEALLAAEGLAVGRGDRTLARELSLHVGAGELIHLRGRNGAGKTTLLETLAGLRAPLAGEIRLGTGTGLHWLGHRNALHPALSALENLRFWCELNGVVHSASAAALDRLGLARLRHRPSRTLSAGQKRRAALARLLAAPRSLWLLDEPLSALDTEGLERFAELLSAHLDGGGGAVVTSHQALPVAAARRRELELR